MRRLSRVLAVALLFFCFSGCIRHTIVAVDAEGYLLTDGEAKRSYGTTTSAFHGLRASQVDVECPYGIAEVYVSSPWYTWFVMYLTVFLVVPLKTSYVCNDPPSAPADAPGTAAGSGGW